MVGLLDIGDLIETVEVRGKKVEVRGISARTFFHLLATIPELADALMGVNPKDISAATLIMKVPDAVSTIIACATVGGPKWAAMSKDEQQKHIDAAGGLNIGEQADFIKKVWDITFPKGTQSFLDALAEVMKLTSAAEQGQLSPGQSKPSAQMDGQPMFGTSHPAN